MITKVTLRQKPISKGRKSLYLDFHPAIKITGTDKTTRREFLSLHIIANIQTKEVIEYGKESKKPYKKIVVVY
jgi:hypothetical protein